MPSATLRTEYDRAIAMTLNRILSDLFIVRHSRPGPIGLGLKAPGTALARGFVSVLPLAFASVQVLALTSASRARTRATSTGCPVCSSNREARLP